MITVLFLLQAEFEDMEKKVQKAIRRSDKKKPERSVSVDCVRRTDLYVAVFLMVSYLPVYFLIQLFCNPLILII